MALGPLGRVWAVARQVEDLFKLQTDTRQALGVIDQRLKALEDRMLRLEAEQTQIINKARGAAIAAATVVAGGVLSDTVTRITRLEIKAEQSEQRRVLSPPAD